MDKGKEKIINIKTASLEPMETFQTIFVLFLKQSYEKISQGNKCNGHLKIFFKIYNQPIL